MNNNNSSSSGGIGFAGLLTIVFIILKLCGVIAWSWWWVLSPLWINAIIAVVIIAIYIAIGVHEARNDTLLKLERKKDKWKF
jgi:hypothetical protein